MAQTILIVAFFLLLASGLALYFVRRPSEAPPPEDVTAAMDDAAERHVRQEALERRSSELLERRAEMDSRRDALGGQKEIFDAFEELERRLQSGGVSEEEFEQEKMRLLGG
jgi:DNA-binding transcriptional MerR regulator